MVEMIDEPALRRELDEHTARIAEIQRLLAEAEIARATAAKTPEQLISDFLSDARQELQALRTAPLAVTTRDIEVWDQVSQRMVSRNLPVDDNKTRATAIVAALREVETMFS